MSHRSKRRSRARSRRMAAASQRAQATTQSTSLVKYSGEVKELTPVESVTARMFNDLHIGRIDRTPRPVFVYGTLREGQGNYNWAIKPRPHRITRGTVRDYGLYPASGFPYIAQEPGEKVIGDLVEFIGGDWAKILSDLDGLEGYRGVGENNLYDRHVVQVETERGLIEAYIYCASESGGTAARIRSTLTIDPEGDWLEWRDLRDRYEMELRARREALMSFVPTI